MTPKVVVFGVDGVRLDVLRQAHTPHLDAVSQAGFLAEVRIPDVNPTVSGPCWATVASGVDADVHGIISNKLHGHRLDENPCFLRRASRAGLRTYAAGGWPPLLSAKSGGPIFAADVVYTPPRRWKTPVGGDDVTDRHVAYDACRVLKRHDVDLAFVYFGQIDSVGHSHGIGDDYVNALARVDAHVGEIREAIASRDGFDAEEWTYLAVTDHGHLDEGGHGGDSDLERTAWIAGSDLDTLQQLPSEQVRHRDMPQLALAPLGVR